MYKKSIVALVFVGFLIALSSCAKAPTEEIEAAKAALARAESNADAREYAPDSIARAKSLVERMDAAVEEKEYESAKNLALEAVSAAEKVIEDGASAKEKARNDAAAAISSAKDLLSEVETSLTAAGKVRGIALDVSATEQELGSAAQEITSAESDFAKEAFTSAQTRAQNARSSLADIQRRIAGAVQAATRRK